MLLKRFCQVRSSGAYWQQVEVEIKTSQYFKSEKNLQQQVQMGVLGLYFHGYKMTLTLAL